MGTCCNCGNDDGVHVVCTDCLEKLDVDSDTNEEVIDYYAESSLFREE